MSFLLMVFLTLICLFPTFPAPPWEATPEAAVVSTLLAVGVVGLHAYWISRRVSRPLSRDPNLRDYLLMRYERHRFVHQILQFGVYGLVLGLLGWGWAVRQLWTWKTGHLPGIDLLTLAPFLAGQMLTWAFYYDADRAAHRAAHRLLDGDPFAHAWLEGRSVTLSPFGSRWSYVAFHLRQKLALVLLPVLLLILRQEVDRQFPHAWESAPWLMNLAGVGSLGVVLIGMPMMIYLALGLTPLPNGPLRDRLLAANRRLGFRCTNLLVWNTRNGMANAMVIGLVPWLRFVVFTDRLLEEFTPDEVEAVFGHEVGHIRHQHMLYYLVFLMLSMTALGVIGDYYLLPWLAQIGEQLVEWQPWLPSSLGEWLGPGGYLAPIPVVVLLLVYIFVVFGYLSRQCERQADLFGCRAVSCQDRACDGHPEGTHYPERGQGLCPTGIRTFIAALEKVALVNGIDRDQPGFLQSWQHSTIARRVSILRQVLLEPEIEGQFQRRLLIVKIGLLTVTSLLLATLLLLHGWQF